MPELADKRLIGHEEVYGVRAGEWRIIYAIRDRELLVLVIRIAARGEAYRDLDQAHVNPP